MQAILTRFRSSEQGTLGTLFIPEVNFSCYTIELPWLDNKPRISCIPIGEYKVIPYSSAKFGQTYLLLGVPNRTGILIHTGNLAGDKSKGYITHSQGCILVGKKTGLISGQKAVLFSVSAMVELRLAVGKNQFSLVVKEGLKEC